MKNIDEFYMQIAINKAWEYQFLTYKNPSVGCVIVDKNGKILSIAAHKKYGDIHAELNAILKAINPLNKKHKSPKDAYEYALCNHQNIFQDATIYITLSPCTHFGKTPPCANLITNLGFKKVVYALRDTQLNVKSDDFLKQNSKDIKIISGILQDQALNLTKPFLQKKTKIFKLTTTLNGNYDGKITNELSDIYTHQIRQNIDLLVIGGNTIRQDRPILDDRKSLMRGKPPDIFVHSRNYKKIDKTIPLFNVKNRSVSGGDILPDLIDKIVLFEGGENFLKLHKDTIDYILLIQNDKLKFGSNNLNINLNTKLLHSRMLGDNIINILEVIKNN